MGEVTSRLMAITNIWSLLKIRYSQWFEGSKVKWIKEDDTNSTFFLTRVKSISK